MAVADQVHLRFATDRDDLLDLLQQFLPAQFSGVELAHFGYVDLRAVASKGMGNAVPVIDAEHAVEAEHAVREHNRVARLGVATGAEQACMDLAGGYCRTQA